MTENPFKKGTMCYFEDNDYYFNIVEVTGRDITYLAEHTKDVFEQVGGPYCHADMDDFTNPYNRDKTKWTFFNERINWKARLGGKK